MKIHPLFPVLLAAVSTAWGAEEKTLTAVSVTVEAESLDERRQAASQKTVVGRREIESLGVPTIGEVLGKLPGIDGAAGGDGTMAMRARGMMRDSVQLLVDGERIGANSRMAMSMISRLPSGELERVEILRGTSAEFGGGTPVTVNLVMRKALAKDTRTFKVALGSREGEPNGNLNLVRGGGDAGFSWLLPVTLFHHGSISDRVVERFDALTGQRQRDEEHGEAPVPGVSIAPRLSWKTGADSFSLSPMLVYTDSDRSTHMYRQTDGLMDGGRADRENGDGLQLRLRAEGEKRVGDSKWTGRLAMMHGNRGSDAWHDRHDALGVHSLDSEALDRREDEASAALRVDHALDSHLLAASVEVASHRRRDSQTVLASTIYRAEARDLTAWVQDEWTPRQGLTFTGGLRGEAARLEVDGAARDYSRLLPSVAVRWEASDGWVLRSSVGSGFKLPRLDELTDLPVTSLSANTPLEPDKRGNPNLRPERSLNFEAVLERYLPGNAGVLGANVYWRATRDFVERRVEWQTTRWVERPYNEGDARHWGLELDAKLNTDAWGAKGGSLRAHLTLPRGEVDDRRLGLERAPRELPAYQLTLGYDQVLPAWQASAGFNAQFYGRVRTDLPGEQWAETDPRSVLDVYVAGRLTPQLNLRLALQNLLASDTRRNAQAWDGANAWTLGGREDGKRNLLLTLEGKW